MARCPSKSQGVHSSCLSKADLPSNHLLPFAEIVVQNNVLPGEVECLHVVGETGSNVELRQRQDMPLAVLFYQVSYDTLAVSSSYCEIENVRFDLGKTGI